jgi:hypothetical protein
MSSIRLLTFNKPQRIQQKSRAPTCSVYLTVRWPSTHFLSWFQFDSSCRELPFHLNFCAVQRFAAWFPIQWVNTAGGIESAYQTNIDRFLLFVISRRHATRAHAANIPLSLKAMHRGYLKVAGNQISWHLQKILNVYNPDSKIERIGEASENEVYVMLFLRNDLFENIRIPLNHRMFSNISVGRDRSATVIVGVKSGDKDRSNWIFLSYFVFRRLRPRGEVRRNFGYFTGLQTSESLVYVDFCKRFWGPGGRGCPLTINI